MSIIEEKINQINNEFELLTETLDRIFEGDNAYIYSHEGVAETTKTLKRMEELVEEARELCPPLTIKNAILVGKIVGFERAADSTIKYVKDTYIKARDAKFNWKVVK